ncbi:MAG: hypothetical protein QG665_377 [Patescibacteria group bacterium]|nr:hypothetical protein [Patescibacteria group bacterium]
MKLISGNHELTLDPTSGEEVLAEATDIFYYIDSDFRNYGLSESAPASQEIGVHVYMMTMPATFLDIFDPTADGCANYVDGFNISDLAVDTLCLTQAQIKNFVHKYTEWLHPQGWSTLFLFKKRENEFFVAEVDQHNDGKLRVNVHEFLDTSWTWIPEGRTRVVVPQH